MGLPIQGSRIDTYNAPSILHFRIDARVTESHDSNTSDELKCLFLLDSIFFFFNKYVRKLNHFILYEK